MQAGRHKAGKRKDRDGRRQLWLAGRQEAGVVSRYRGGKQAGRGKMWQTGRGGKQTDRGRCGRQAAVVSRQKGGRWGRQAGVASRQTGADVAGRGGR